MYVYFYCVHYRKVERALGYSCKDISLKDDKPSEIFLFQLENNLSKECYLSK